MSRERLAMVADTLVNGQRVDAALAQTSNAGLSYAVVPMPWMIDWFAYVEHCFERGRAVKFDWEKHCGLPGWSFTGTQEDIDDEGNFRFCFLEPGHDGTCGSPSVRKETG